MPDADSMPARSKPARHSGLAVAVAWLAGAGIPLIAIGFGSWLLARNFTAAGPEFLMRYVFGERDMEPLKLDATLRIPLIPAPIWRRTSTTSSRGTGPLSAAISSSSLPAR